MDSRVRVRLELDSRGHHTRFCIYIYTPINDHTYKTDKITEILPPKILPDFIT
jgi:hypothetical protein